MKKLRNFVFDEAKNAKLKTERGVSFQQIIRELEADREIDVVKYPNQQIFIVEINEYIYAAPFVEDDGRYFLKTIFPSRKLTKEYWSKTEDLKQLREIAETEGLPYQILVTSILHKYTTGKLKEA